MSRLSERLTEYMDFMGLRQKGLAEILRRTPQAVNQWFPSPSPAVKVRVPFFEDLVEIADRLGVSLDWLSGRAVEPMWAPQIQTARVWLAGQLDRVDGRNDPLFPMNVRIRSLLRIMAEQVPLLNQAWFAGGVLGIPIEAYQTFLAGGGTVTPMMLSRLERFTGVPQRWLMGGADADRQPVTNMGEYTGVLARLIAKGISPDRLEQIADLIIQTNAIM